MRIKCRLGWHNWNNWKYVGEDTFVYKRDITEVILDIPEIVTVRSKYVRCCEDCGKPEVKYIK